MNRFTTPDLSRRNFIGACCATVGATGMLSTLAQLRAIGGAADASVPMPTSGISARERGDYKALVCLFLAGGNDANNVIIANDTAGYAAYKAARGSIALPQEGLLPLSVRNGDGRSFALHPAMGDLRDLFSGQHAAVIANVGTLVVPTTKDQFKNRSVPLPNAL